MSTAYANLLPSIFDSSDSSASGDDSVRNDDESVRFNAHENIYSYRLPAGIRLEPFSLNGYDGFTLRPPPGKCCPCSELHVKSSLPPSPTVAPPHCTDCVNNRKRPRHPSTTDNERERAAGLTVRELLGLPPTNPRPDPCLGISPLDCADFTATGGTSRVAQGARRPLGYLALPRQSTTVQRLPTPTVPLRQSSTLADQLQIVFSSERHRNLLDHNNLAAQRASTFVHWPTASPNYQPELGASTDADLRIMGSAVSSDTSGQFQLQGLHCSWTDRRATRSGLMSCCSSSGVGVVSTNGGSTTRLYPRDFNYADPMPGSSLAFQRRLTDMSTLEARTKVWERRRCVGAALPGLNAAAGPAAGCVCLHHARARLATATCVTPAAVAAAVVQ